MAVLRWTLFAVSVYGLLAFVAFHCTMCQHPHLLRGDALLLRFGHFRTAGLPLGSLVSVTGDVDNTHEKNVALTDGRLAIAFMGGTNVELRFSPDAVVELDGREHAVSRVALLAVEPGSVTALLSDRVRSP